MVNQMSPSFFIAVEHECNNYGLLPALMYIAVKVRTRKNQRLKTLDNKAFLSSHLFSHIAGPVKASVNDMWRMVWQERVGKIVMLTNLVENGKVIN